jgi:ferredoxin
MLTCTVRSPDGDVAAFPVRDGHRVLHEMLLRPGHDIPVGCRGGGCGVCRVQVVSGEYLTRRMSRAHISEADEAVGIVLACRLIPLTDVVVEPMSTTNQPPAMNAAPAAP